MKKVLVFMLLLFIGLSAMAQQRIQLRSTDRAECVRSDMASLQASFSFSAIEAEDYQSDRGTFSWLSLPNTVIGGNEGDPQIPVYNELIAVPFGATPRVEITSYSTTEYRLADYDMKTLVPRQPSLRKDKRPGDVPFVMNEAAYQSSRAVRNTPKAVVEVVGTMRGVRLGKLTVEPVSYDPVNNTIRVFNDIEVTVHFDGANARATKQKLVDTYSPYFDVVYAQLFNGNSVRSAYDDHQDLYTTPVKMMVITTETYANNATFQEWVNWKKQKGIYTTVYTTATTGTTAESIKSFIRNKYATDAPTFVVIVGDVDDVTYSLSSSTTSKVTDLYYSTTEDNDLWPEMFLSRMPVSSTTELENLLNKIMTYEKYTMADPSYLSNVLLIAGSDGTWNPRVGQPTINYAADNYFNAAHGFTNVYKYLDSYTNCYSNMNTGIGFANYTAHGGETGWSGPSFSVSDANSLTNNDKYFWAMGNCCLAANWGYSGTCLAEALLRSANKGAFGYIGSCPETYWWEDYYFGVGATSVTNSTPSMSQTQTGVYDGIFMDDMYNTLNSVPFLGNIAVAYAHANSYTSSVSDQYYWEAYHTLGDGSVMPYHTQPVANNVSHASTISIGMTSFAVSADAGSYVSISKDNEILGVAQVPASGNVNVPVSDLNSAGDVMIVVTRQQRQPYITTIQAIAANGPYVSLESYTPNTALVGESTNLNLTFKNVGTQAISGTTTVTLTSPDATFGVNTKTFSALAVDATTTVSGFSFTLNNDVTLGAPVAIHYAAVNGSDTWEGNFNIMPDQIYTVSVASVNNNYGTVSGGGQVHYGVSCTVTATPAVGYMFTGWTLNGNVVSTETSYTFNVTGNMNLVANFAAGALIGSGTTTNNNLPLNNYYKYSLTQQIYTAEELGAASTIQSIGFYKDNSVECVRNLNIYMVSTSKSGFESTTDWIPVTAADLVFSGTVTFADQDWTNIELENMFNYDGLSNVAIIVDDNTGSYKSTTSFLAFSASDQALRVYSDGTDYDPENAGSYTGTIETSKNQLRILTGEAPTCMKPSGVTVNYTGGTTAEVSWNTTASSSNLSVNGTQISNVTSPYTLTGLTLATNYDVQVQANCGGDDLSAWTSAVRFTTDACMPADRCNISLDLTDSYGDGWNGAAIQVVDATTEAVLGQFTNTSDAAAGETQTYTLAVCNGQTINFVWVSGSYNSECSYSVTDANGEEIFSGSGAMTSTVNYTVNCGAVSCARPTGLTVSNVTAHTATLAWTENGTATAWQVCLNDDESNPINVNTNPYTLTNLAPETAYSIKVRANCGTGNQSSWSNVVSCTTLVACPAPTGLAVALTQGNGSVATLSWTENGDATAWQICLNDDETNLMDVTTNPYTLTGLTAESGYTAKVRANCGGNDGTSAWTSTVSFTPTNNNVIGSGTATNNYLPSYTFYNYSLTQQIYTAEEIGTAGTINSIAFYNAGSAKTRSYDMYLVHTNKASFDNSTDWITVTADDMVFSGEVDMAANEWTVFELDGFEYDGSSNLALIMDDNTGSYSSGMACLVFDASNMAIRVYSDGTNYDPTAPGSYSGTVLSVKNQIQLGITPFGSTVCEKPATVEANNVTAHEAVLSWTEGSGTYNVEYKRTSDNDWSVYVSGVTGLTITLNGLSQATDYQARVQSVCGSEVSGWKSVSFSTLVACPAPANLAAETVPGDGTSAVLSWEEAAAATAWQIILNGDESNLVMANSNPFTLTGLTPETVYTAQVRAYCDDVDQSNWSNSVTFEPSEKIVIGSGTGTQSYVPVNNYYNYSFTQQIYTVDELGEAGVIESIDFYKPNTTSAERNVNVYMVNTDKDMFESTTDWIIVSDADLVYSGTVTFADNAWTTITLDNPFIYDGTQNMAVIVDDNTGSYVGSTTFRTFSTSNQQAIYYQSDSNNPDPANPPTASGRMSSKNQIRVLKGAMSDCMKPTSFAASNVTPTSVDLSWNENGASESWRIEYWSVNSEVTDGGVIEMVTENPFTLTGLLSETQYEAFVIPTCGVEEGDPDNSLMSSVITFTTLPACPAPTDLTYSILADGVNVGWNGFSDSYNVQYGLDNPAFKVSTDFEDQAIPQICENDTAYPWTIEAGHGGYYIKSGNAGVSASTSAISVTMEYPEDGIVAFDAECRGEGTSTYWDHCDFYVDSVRNLFAGANVSGWNHYEFEVPAGTHTFTWSYTKDGSVNPSGDYFAVDNVVMRSLSNIEWSDAVTVTGNNVDLPLSEAGEYYVQVQGVCDGATGEWSELMAFNFTPSNCLISLNQANNYTWTETFEGYTNIMNPRWTGAAVPCWTLVEEYTGAAMNQIGDQIDTLPQIYRAFNTTEDGDYTLRIHFNSLIAMPELDEDVDLANLHLSLNVRQPYWRYKLQIGVMTDINDPESFVPVAVVNNTTKNMTHYECGFWSVKELVGAGRHIAFKNIGNAEHDPYSTNYLDDITLTYVDEAECTIMDLPYVEDFEDYTAGYEPDCWVLVSEDATLESTTRPQVYAGFNTTEEGSNTLRMRNRCVYAMPMFSEDVVVSEMTMTFNLRQPNALYRLQVGVVNNAGEFTPVKTLKCSSTEMEAKTVNFTNFASDDRIAFRNTLVPGTGMATDYLEYSYNYIDDINVYITQGNRNGANDEDGMNADLDNIAVYPNPTTGVLYIDAVGVQKVECYSQMGQLVRVYDNANEISLGDLADGVYMLRITVPQGVTMRKVVKR